MIDAETFRQYCDSVKALTDAASGGVEREVLAWCRGHPDASAAEAREHSKAVMEAWAETYDEAAASLAAEFYDSTVGGEARLPSAITETVYDPAKTDDVARYQVKKLMDGDIEGFARACGEYAANDAKRSLNRTIMGNVARDRKRGVRFARILTGRENCPFCIMLASRGAVYHTRQSAGEFAHFHRNCDCKVVAGLADDPMATLVEGHDPLDCRRVYERIVSARTDEISAMVTAAERASELGEIQKGLSEAEARYRAMGKTANAYRATVGKFIESLSENGTLKVEDFTSLEPFEIQEAAWIASTGRTVVLRNADAHKFSDGNTSDAAVDGQTCDFKRVRSANPKKIASRVFEHPTQGPNYIVDITCSAISEQAALAKCSWILNDRRIESIGIISVAGLTTLKK